MCVLVGVLSGPGQHGGDRATRIHGSVYGESGACEVSVHPPFLTSYVYTLLHTTYSTLFSDICSLLIFLSSFLLDFLFLNQPTLLSFLDPHCLLLPSALLSSCFPLLFSFPLISTLHLLSLSSPCPPLFAAPSLTSHPPHPLFFTSWTPQIRCSPSIGGG